MAAARSITRRAPLAAWILLSLPALGLCLRTASGRLGPDPVEALTHETGEWALRCLLLCLAVTPLRRATAWSWLAPLRRPLGLLAFAYASAHLSVYAFLDQELDGSLLLEDVTERPYITAGFTAWLCMLPLAVTSTRAWMRRLGRRWQVLHRAVYAAGIAAVLHFLWLVKADWLEPAIYGVLLALLLAARLVRPRRAA